MNDRSVSTTPADDDWLDAALRADGREHRAAYLDDGGFTARVMAALPATGGAPRVAQAGAHRALGGGGHRHRRGLARHGGRILATTSSG